MILTTVHRQMGLSTKEYSPLLNKTLPCSLQSLQTDSSVKKGTKRSSPTSDSDGQSEGSPKRKVPRRESTIFNGAPTSKKNKIAIPVHDIVRLLTVPQPIAAKALNVSVSTLKRRYYVSSLKKYTNTLRN